MTQTLSMDITETSHSQSHSPFLSLSLSLSDTHSLSVSLCLCLSVSVSLSLSLSCYNKWLALNHSNSPACLITSKQIERMIHRSLACSLDTKCARCQKPRFQDKCYRQQSISLRYTRVLLHQKPKGYHVGRRERVNLILLE